jgi:hypothetical protein
MNIATILRKVNREPAVSLASGRRGANLNLVAVAFGFRP